MARTEPAKTDDPQPDDIGLDDLFDVLANHRRRFIIDQVGSADAGEWLPLGALAEGQAFIESDAESIEQVSSGDRKIAYTAFQQIHLPKLQEVGLIRYDDQRQAVSRTAATAYALDIIRYVIRNRSGVGSGAGRVRGRR